MRRILTFALLSMILVFASCNIITEPVPVIGNYLVRNRVGSDGYIHCFSLKADGTFIFIQRGGASTTETFIFKGTWESSLNHFDFYSASGTITFTPEEPKEVAYESLVFTVGEDNVFNFQWILDRGSVNATLSLDAVNDGLSNDIGTAQNISDTEFNEKLQDAEDKINGVVDTPSDEESPDDSEDADDTDSDDNPSTENPDDTPQQPPVEDEEEQPDSDGNESGEEEVVPPEEGTTEEEEKI